MRLDKNEKLPSGMEEYINTYGWHFSKKMCEFACSNMYNNKGSITPYSKDEVDALLKKYNTQLMHKINYDYVFVANMCKADYLGSSVPNEAYLVKYIKDVVDDADGYPELPFTRYYGDCIGKGIQPDWEDMI